MKSPMRSFSPKPRNTGTTISAFSPSVACGSIEVRPQANRCPVCWSAYALRTALGTSRARKAPGAGREVPSRGTPAKLSLRQLHHVLLEDGPVFGQFPFGFGQELGEPDATVSEDGHGIKGRVPGLLHGEEHAAHGVPDTDGGQARQRAELGYQRSCGQPIENEPVGPVIGGTGQARGDQSQVLHLAGGSQPEMIEGDNDKAPGGEVLGHAVASMARNLEIEIEGGTAPAGQAAQNNRGPGRVQSERGPHPPPHHHRAREGHEVGYVYLDVAPECLGPSNANGRLHRHPGTFPSSRCSVSRPTGPRIRLHRPATSRSRHRRSRTRA